MPIVDIEMVIEPGEMPAVGLAKTLSDAAAKVFETPAGRTWVRLRALPSAQYAENGDGPAEGVRPVFVTILKSKRPTGETLREETGRLTEAIATVCGRPAENVHVLWLPEAKGRMAFGGRLVEQDSP